MLPKKNRLVKKNDFERILKFGDSFFIRILGARVLGNRAGGTRVGFIVSNKIAKKANKRNRLKRRLREIIRLKLKEKKIKPGYDFVLIARSGILEKNYTQLDQEVGFVLKKLRILED